MALCRHLSRRADAVPTRHSGMAIATIRLAPTAADMRVPTVRAAHVERPRPATSGKSGAASPAGRTNAAARASLPARCESERRKGGLQG